MDNEVVKNTKINISRTKKKKKIDKQTSDMTTLIYINQYNTDKQNLEHKIGDVNKKIPDIRRLLTATALNTKIIKVKNNIPAVSDLVKKTDYDVNILEIDGKYPTTSKLKKILRVIYLMQRERRKN